jgi:hypothetical protein
MCNNNKSPYGLSENIITSPADNDTLSCGQEENSVDKRRIGWRDLVIKNERW